MKVTDHIKNFSRRFQKRLTINKVQWTYYKVGAGNTVFWLTGGLRRAATGFEFIELLGQNYTVIAPDYPPLMTVEEFIEGFDAILEIEGVETIDLAAQSYGGLLAQIYLSRRPEKVKRMILSSSGPADYGRIWLPVEFAFLEMARLLPIKILKNLFRKAISIVLVNPEKDQAEWKKAIDDILHQEITRMDMISHFSVALDMVRRQIVSHQAYRGWKGPVWILSSKNDITQSVNDMNRFERLFSCPVEFVSLDDMGHSASFCYPSRYASLIEEILRVPI